METDNGQFGFPKVVILLNLPLRNGNRGDRAGAAGHSGLLNLPLRNGNMRGSGTVTFTTAILLNLPLRNGNRPVEQRPGRREHALESSFKEWKQPGYVELYPLMRGALESSFKEWKHQQPVFNFQNGVLS